MSQLDRIHGYLKRIIGAHEEIAGVQSFHWKSVEFRCSPRVFSPLLSESSFAFASALLSRGFEGAGVDAGCGCGILGIALAMSGVASVVSFDCSPSAIKDTMANASSARVSERLIAFQADHVPKLAEPVDVFVANPPFFDSRPKERWQMAFCDPRHAFFKKTVRAAKQVLSPTGELWLAQGGDLTVSFVENYLAKTGFSCIKVVTTVPGELGVGIVSAAAPSSSKHLGRDNGGSVEHPGA